MHIVTAGVYGHAIKTRLAGTTISNDVVEGEVNFIDSPRVMKLGVNSSNASMAMSLSPEDYNDFNKSFDASGKPVTFLYSGFNGTEFAPWIEVNTVARMMNDDVGRNVGFSGGVASNVEPNRVPQYVDRMQKPSIV